MHLQQVFYARILQHRPQIPYEPRLRIQAKQIAERFQRVRPRPAITTAHGHSHISQRVHLQAVGAELQMSGLMGSHDEIQPLVFFGGWIPPEQRRQHEGFPIGAHHRARRRFRDPFRPRRNRDLGAAQTLNE
jgi:hypothetical protein